MKNRIVHIMVLDKFIPPYIDFINCYFDREMHEFIIIGKPKFEYDLTPEHKVTWIDSKIKVFNLLKNLYRANKIILHGLWNEKIIQLLLMQPWLIKKCYWVMWGGDFYFPELQSDRKKNLIKQLRHFITYIPGDFDYIIEKYNVKGEYHECLGYLSNIVNERIISLSNEYLKRLSNFNNGKNYTINILIGNSATKTNNHLEMTEKLKPFATENIKIFAPLSYGDKAYAQEIINIGKKIFSDKFVPLMEFMPYDEYIRFLSKIDIAIFANNRQQAMGNIISLLAMGKKVYIKSNTSQWRLFNKLGITVYDFNGKIDLSLMDTGTAKLNIEKMIEYFSEENLKKQWERIFELRGV